MPSIPTRISAALVTCLMGWNAMSVASERFDIIEIRLVAENPGIDGPRLTLDGTEQVVEVETAPLLSSSDFVGTGDVGRTEGKAGFEVQLTRSGAETLKRISTENVGRSLALIVDGKLLMTPKILDPIVADGFLVTVNGSEAEARGLAAKINKAIAKKGG